LNTTHNGNLRIFTGLAYDYSDFLAFLKDSVGINHFSSLALCSSSCSRV